MADIKSGFVILWRSFYEWEWYTDENTMRLFLHLVLTVNYETKKWRGIVIERGSRICTIRGLSKELKMSDRSVRTALSHLISTQEVTRQVTQYGTLVTVVNYGKYQDKSESATQESTQEVTSDRHTTDTRPTHTKQRNKETKETSNIYIVPEILLEEWKSYVEMRKSIKKPLTDRAAQMALDTLEKLYPADYEKQKDCLNQSTFHCWSGLFEIKEAQGERLDRTNKKGVSEHRRGPYSDIGNSL